MPMQSGAFSLACSRSRASAFGSDRQHTTQRDPLPPERCTRLKPLRRYTAAPFHRRFTMTLPLDSRGLCKSFDRPAVAGLDLCVRQGEFYSLLGPNGAGKTTTLRMVAGLLPPDAGTIAICGIDALRNSVEAKRIVAWVSDEPMIYDKLTPYEYLEFVAGLWALDADIAERR